MTLFITHSACLEHLTPPGHPERPARLRAIEQVIEQEKFMFLLREQCPKAELEVIALCHPWEYIERIRRAVPQIGLVELNDDTVLSAGSFEASLHAAGGAILAVDGVMAGKAKNAFVAIRPAGHHAEATTAMGFCLFNNAAIAVRHAQRRCGAERAAIVDFRCPSRQRLPANLLERSDGDVLLNSRDAALSGYRFDDRVRRIQQRCQRAAARG